MHLDMKGITWWISTANSPSVTHYKWPPDMSKYISELQNKVNVIKIKLCHGTSVS